MQRAGDKTLAAINNENVRAHCLYTSPRAKSLASNQYNQRACIQTNYTNGCSQTSEDGMNRSSRGIAQDYQLS